MMRNAGPPSLDSASVAVDGRAMVAYLAIFGASLAGYAGLAGYVIVAAVIVLTSISYAEHGRTYTRARDLGLSDVADFVMLRSVLNAVIASGAAYGFGYVVRLI